MPRSFVSPKRNEKDREKKLFSSKLENSSFFFLLFLRRRRARSMLLCAPSFLDFLILKKNNNTKSELFFPFSNLRLFFVCECVNTNGVRGTGFLYGLFDIEDDALSLSLSFLFIDEHRYFFNIKLIDRLLLLLLLLLTLEPSFLICKVLGNKSKVLDWHQRVTH